MGLHTLFLINDEFHNFERSAHKNDSLLGVVKVAGLNHEQNVFKLNLTFLYFKNVYLFWRLVILKFSFDKLVFLAKLAFEVSSQNIFLIIIFFLL